MIKDITVILGIAVMGFFIGGFVLPKLLPTVEVKATNGRYVGVFETGSGQAQAIAFRDKATCETAAQHLHTVVADPGNADALAAAGGKIWLMPCTPVNSELITK